MPTTACMKKSSLDTMTIDKASYRPTSLHGFGSKRVFKKFPIAESIAKHHSLLYV